MRPRMMFEQAKRDELRRCLCILAAGLHDVNSAGDMDPAYLARRSMQVLRAIEAQIDNETP